MIYTDHRPLMNTLQTISNQYTPHKIQHLDFTSQYTSDICFISGKYIYCSQYTVMNDNCSINLRYTVTWSNNPRNKRKTCCCKHDLWLVEFPAPFENRNYYCDTTKSNPSPYSPSSLRKWSFVIFMNYHTWEMSYNQTHLWTFHMMA